MLIPQETMARVVIFGWLTADPDVHNENMGIEGRIDFDKILPDYHPMRHLDLTFQLQLGFDAIIHHGFLKPNTLTPTNCANCPKLSKEGTIDRLAGQGLQSTQHATSDHLAQCTKEYKREVKAKIRAILTDEGDLKDKLTSAIRDYKSLFQDSDIPPPEELTSFCEYAQGHINQSLTFAASSDDDQKVHNLWRLSCLIGQLEFFKSNLEHWDKTSYGGRPSKEYGPTDDTPTDRKDGNKNTITDLYDARITEMIAILASNDQELQREYYPESMIVGHMPDQVHEKQDAAMGMEPSRIVTKAFTLVKSINPECLPGRHRGRTRSSYDPSNEIAHGIESELLTNVCEYHILRKEFQNQNIGTSEVLSRVTYKSSLADWLEAQSEWTAMGFRATNSTRSIRKARKNELFYTNDEDQLYENVLLILRTIISQIGELTSTKICARKGMVLYSAYSTENPTSRGETTGSYTTSSSTAGKTISCAPGAAQVARPSVSPGAAQVARPSVAPEVAQVGAAALEVEEVEEVQPSSCVSTFYKYFCCFANKPQAVAEQTTII